MSPVLDSPIDNEVAAYRALSKMAIISVILGLASIFTFTTDYLAVLGLAGLVAGIISITTIKRHPDIYTGEKLANLGIALSILFTLCPLTIHVVQSLMNHREGRKFAEFYVATAEKGTIEELIYLQSPPSSRVDKTPTEIAKEMRQTSDRKMSEFEMMNGGLIAFKKRVPGNTPVKLELVRIQGEQVVGLTYHAAALIKINGGANEEHPKDPDYAFAVFQCNLDSPKREWTVSRLDYPARVKIDKAE
jgi:hypothetical protein